VKKKFKIIFMGTPDFSVPALKALHKSGHQVDLVVTRPDQPSGRGKIISYSPVKKEAIKLGCEVIQPDSIKTKAFEERLSQIEPEFFVVVAFGHILPKNILAIPKIAAINIHASLLPKYRGAAPIQWAIINGEKETGVTTMLMDEGMDTGDILLGSKVGIEPDDTSETLHDRLAVIGADILIKTLNAFETGDIHPVSQDHSQATYAPSLKKSEGHIDWEKPAEKLESFIRGVTPWPGAFTFHGNMRLKIFKAKPLPINVDKPPGTVLDGFPDELWIATGEGALSILEIQAASGKRLLIKEFLKGYKITPGTILR
jgi:methionyl-tRNA formyltransferase